MGLGVGIVLMAAGAILALAVDVGPTGDIDLHQVGVVMVALGAAGILLTPGSWSWRPGSRRRPRTHTNRPGFERREAIIEEF